MTWNYRVVRRPSSFEGGETFLAIHEAYYPKNSDKSDSITEEAARVLGDDLEGLRRTLQKMLEALEKPILDYEAF